MGGCLLNYDLIKVTPPHCVVLCLHKPLVFDKRTVCMLPCSPPLRWRPTPTPHLLRLYI